MKNKILCLILLFHSIIIVGQNDKEQEARAHQKNLKINTINTTSQEAIGLFSKDYNLNKGYSFSSVTSNNDKVNLKHEKFQQFYKNIKVEYGTVITHSNAQGVYLVNGELYNANTLDINPTISKQQGLNAALNSINASKYLWEDSDQSEIVEYTKPEGELIIFPNVNTNEVHLAYKYDVYSIIPITRQEIYVDAHTGNVLFSNATIKHANTLVSKYNDTENSKKLEEKILTPGTAATRYSGSRSIETKLLGSNYILQDDSRGNGIKTYNCEKGGYQDVDFIDNDNDWTSAEHNNFNKDNAALDAHWGAEKTYDFWLTVFGRNSFDDNGAVIKSYVHFNTNYANASWNGSFMTYGDGNASLQPLTSIDVCGHEIGHAICTYTANLVYQNQSGALNEGFSDIWGACIEKHGRTGTLSGTLASGIWLIGEDFATNPLRSMSNPLANGDPNTYLGTNWYSGTADSGGVHTNSGVLNHWFYILTVGKSGTNNAPSPDTYSVTGIGMQKAAEIAYIAERDYLTPNSTYADARIATIEAASSIYCANSPEVIAVTNAWFAVNVGEQYINVANDVALQTITNVSNITCGAPLFPILSLRNQGLNTITNVTITYTIDGGTPVNQNWSGGLDPCTSTNYSLTINGLSRGAHLLEVTTTIVNDGRVENNTKSVLLLVNDSGIIGSVNPFTNSTNALIAYDENSITSTWKIGFRNGNAMTSSGNSVYTTNLTGNYLDQKKAFLVSQCYNLTNVANPQISFSMKYDLEINWDIVYVEYSTNFGQNWNVLGQMGTNWYNSDRTNASSGTANDCQNCPGAQWTGTNTTSSTYTYPLTSLMGQSNVIFRIVFHTDEAVNQLGVNVDNFVINGVLGSENFELNNILIYPNPSNGIYNINLGIVNPNLIEVYDLTGKIILTKNNFTITNSETIIDLSSASQGVYFVKIVEDNLQIVKRIIKQ